MAVYTGQVTGVSKIATETPSAFCRAISGGSFKRNPNSIEKKGIGNQIHRVRGVDEIDLEFTCVGVDKTDLQLFFPTTVAPNVTGFPDFLVEVDDGTGGQEFVLGGCEPSSITISLAENGEIEYKVAIKAASATEAAIGTDVPVYNAYSGHSIVHAATTVGGAAVGMVSFELSNDCGAQFYKTMDSAAGIAATGVVITTQNPTLKFATTDSLNIAGMDGAFTPVDIVITLANGTAGENITITCNDMEPTSWEMPLEAEGIIYFAHEYALSSGALFNRIVFT